MSVESWRWHKSPYSGDHRCCVEVAIDATGQRWIRDSKQPDVAIGPFTPDEWEAFRSAVTVGDL